jgi:hypothetical protein
MIFSFIVSSFCFLIFCILFYIATGSSGCVRFTLESVARADLLKEKAMNALRLEPKKIHKELLSPKAPLNTTNPIEEVENLEPFQPSFLQKAFVWKEIFDKPKALKTPFERF